MWDRHHDVLGIDDRAYMPAAPHRATITDDANGSTNLCRTHRVGKRRHGAIGRRTRATGTQPSLPRMGTAK